MYHRLFYISNASPDFRTDQLGALMKTCIENNERNDIVGALIYNGQQFAQILEGEETAVVQLLEKIKKDPRHSDVRLIASRPVGRRHFESWYMLRIDEDDFGAFHDVMKLN